MEKKSTLALATLITALSGSGFAQSQGTYAPPPDTLQEQLLKSQLRPVRVPAPVPRLLPGSPEIVFPPQIQVRHEPWQLNDIQRDQQTWTSTEVRINPVTGKETRRKVEVTEVGSGLNYRDANGQWQPTREEFSALPDGGFIANHGPHQLRLESNINSVTAIDFVSSDGLRLRNGPLAVGYYDPRDGRSPRLHGRE